MDVLENVEAGSLCGLGQGALLSIGEVGWDGDDGGGDLLANEVGSGLLQAAQMASDDVGNGDGVLVLRLGVVDVESNCRRVLGGVCGSVGWRRVYRLEAVSFVVSAVEGGEGVRKDDALLAQVVSEVCDRVLWIPDELCLCLSALELFALDIGQYRRDLTICVV